MWDITGFNMSERIGKIWNKETSIGHNGIFPRMWVFSVSTVLPGLGYIHTLMVGSFNIWLDCNNERLFVQILQNR